MSKNTEQPTRITRLNHSGVKSAAYMWRTFGGEHYPQYWSDPTPALIADLRKGGIRCRRVGTELFVHHADIGKAATIQAEHDRRRNAARAEMNS